MRRVMSLWIGCWLAVATAAAQPVEEPAVDLLSAAQGAILVQASVNPGKALDLINGNSDDQAWNNLGGKVPPPYDFVVEMLAPTVLRQVGFNTASARPGGVEGGAARTVAIAVSAEGPESGFTELGTIEVEADSEAFLDVAHPEPVRWVKFTIVDNHGSETWTYADEFLAYGDQDPVPSDDGRYAGLYDTNLKLVELKQDGTQVTDCYENGTLFGTVERGIARLTWRDKAGVGGQAWFVIDSAGNLNGMRYRHKSRMQWFGPPTTDGATACSEPAEPGNPILDELALGGEAILYGIYFDHDSDVLKPESEPVLQSLLAALREAPDLRLIVEGHTDSDGSDDYNLDLSARRAAAVVQWLAGNGIDSTRLTPVGKGESHPVADNNTADGKALNRRVEVVSQS